MALEKVGRTYRLDKVSRPKKLTGTRFASVLGLNRWSTPFQTWCEITKAYSPPFEDTIYTLAGKAIEPKQIAYMRRAWGMDNLKDPTDVFGKDYFSKTYGDFYRDVDVFGGMWDAILTDEDGKAEGVLEFKTTKRAEDWQDDIPDYYALQAALYAYLLDVDVVYMVVSFLQTSDYDHPEDYQVSVDNTAVFDFKVSERYPNFREDYIEPALEWWSEHIVTGISPEFDDRLDAEYLKGLSTQIVEVDASTQSLIQELKELVKQEKAMQEQAKPRTERIKLIKQALKTELEDAIGDSDYAEISEGTTKVKLTRSMAFVVDDKALKRDGLFDKYATQKTTDRLTISF